MHSADLQKRIGGNSARFSLKNQAFFECWARAVTARLPVRNGRIARRGAGDVPRAARRRAARGVSKRRFSRLKRAQKA